MIIGIYAPKPNMGASTLALQLSIHLASSREPVLLTEMDYRNPSTAIRFKLADGDRSLEHAVSDYIGKPKWRLQDYVLPCGDPSTNNVAEGKLPPGLSVLLPSGLRGFETFPTEPMSFVDDLLAQARDMAFTWIILDISSEMDSTLTLTALQRLDLCLILDDGDVALANILHHRLQLWDHLGLCGNRIRVLYRMKPGQRGEPKAHPLPPPAVVFPYVRGMAGREMNRCRSRTYRKALHRLIQSFRERRENG